MSGGLGQNTRTPRNTYPDTPSPFDSLVKNKSTRKMHPNNLFAEPAGFVGVPGSPLNLAPAQPPSKDIATDLNVSMPSAFF